MSESTRIKSVPHPLFPEAHNTLIAGALEGMGKLQAPLRDATERHVRLERHYRNETVDSSFGRPLHETASENHHRVVLRHG